MTETENLVDALIVEKSPIKSGGRARVNIEILKELKIDTGQQVVISSEKKDILVKVYGDTLMDKGKIRLRILDLKKLDVERGDEVTIREHEKLLSRLL